MNTAELKKEFEDGGCSSMWYEVYDHLDTEPVITNCIERALRLYKIPIAELTKAEINFIHMVESWD